MWRLATGLVAGAVAGAVALAIWGARGAIAAMTLATVATVLHWLAARVTSRVDPDAGVERTTLYGLGMVVRLAGVVILGAAVTNDTERFPPLPAALGYLGAALPLLFMETRTRR